MLVNDKPHRRGRSLGAVGLLAPARDGHGFVQERSVRLGCPESRDFSQDCGHTSGIFVHERFHLRVQRVDVGVGEKVGVRILCSLGEH